MTEAAKRKKGWNARDIVLTLVLVVVIGGLVTARAFYRPFRIPSNSMAPSVLAGEYVVTPNVTRTNGVPDVHVGDVVFHSQADEPGRTFIRRVLAMPGQRIAFRDGVPIVDGVAAQQAATGETGPEGERIMRETLAGRSYLVAYRLDEGLPELRDTREWVVPAGQVFLIGDARDNSNDSRIQGPQPLTSIMQAGGWIIYSTQTGRTGRTIE